MQQLVMNNRIIRGVIDYIENFSADNILRNKNIAAGFFLNKMRHISPLTEYHTEIFFQLMYMTPAELRLFKKPSDYMTLATFAQHSITGNSLIELKKLMEEEKLNVLVESTWNIAQGTNLENIEKIRLFCLLTSAYGLAQHSPDDKGFEITSEQAERAYLESPEPESEVVKEIAFSSDCINIEKPARNEPYEIYLKGREASELLKNGSIITHKKLTAIPHQYGVQGVNVTLHIYNEDSSTPIVRILKPHEYVYINTVNEIPVLVQHIIPTDKQDGTILCYAEEYPKSYITVKLNKNNKGIIDDSNDRNHMSNGLGGYSAVEIIFDKKRSQYIFLDNKGNIYDKGKTPNEEKCYATIEDYLKETTK